MELELGGWVWSEGQLELSWSQPVPGAFYQFCQGENAIHAWLGLALLYSVSYPSSPPSIHFLTANYWDYVEKNCSSRRDTTIHVCAEDYHEDRKVADCGQNPTHTTGALHIVDTYTSVILQTRLLLTCLFSVATIFLTSTTSMISGYQPCVCACKLVCLSIWKKPSTPSL